MLWSLMLQAGAAAGAPGGDEARPPRIDGGDLRRETLFSGVDSKQRNWLSESDVSFFTGGGPSEAVGADGLSQEEQAVVQVRGGGEPAPPAVHNPAWQWLQSCVPETGLRCSDGCSVIPRAGAALDLLPALKLLHTQLRLRSLALPCRSAA